MPTPSDTLRVKVYLLVKRNQTGDHLDVAAPADRFGLDWAADVLRMIDDYYTDPLRAATAWPYSSFASSELRNHGVHHRRAVVVQAAAASLPGLGSGVRAG